SAQIREILISESAWEEMTCLFAPSLEGSTPEFDTAIAAACSAHKYLRKHLPAGVNYTGPTDLKVYGQDVGRAVLNKIIL
ncbi:hypothetical protein HCH35_29600, partial [Klebsiella michiganensis]|nr:hypothetical protein [Klebsiella michiganensis]